MESISLLFKVLWSPGEAMSQAAKRAKVLAPILLLLVGTVGYTLVTFKYLDGAQIAVRAMERQGREMTAEQKAQMTQTMNSPLVHAAGLVFGCIGTVLMILIVAALFFGVFTFVGRDGGFKSFFAVTALAFVPLMVRLIVSTVTVIAVPQGELSIDEIGSISPALFLDRTGMSKALFAAINTVDVVSIWILILLVIGFRFVTTRSVSSTVRAVCVFGVWVVWIAIRAALAPFIPS